MADDVLEAGQRRRLPRRGHGDPRHGQGRRGAGRCILRQAVEPEARGGIPDPAGKRFHEAEGRLVVALHDPEPVAEKPVPVGDETSQEIPVARPGHPGRCALQERLDPEGGGNRPRLQGSLGPMKVDDGEGRGEGRHRQCRGDGDQRDGHVLRLQGVLHQVRDAPRAEDHRRAVGAFPHDPADPLQAVVRGVEPSGGHGEHLGEIGPVVRDPRRAQQGAELGVDVRRGALGALLGGAVHEDPEPPACGQGRPMPLRQRVAQIGQGLGVMLDGHKGGLFAVLVNSLPFQRLLKGRKPTFHRIGPIGFRGWGSVNNGKPKVKRAGKRLSFGGKSLKVARKSGISSFFPLGREGGSGPESRSRMLAVRREP